MAMQTGRCKAPREDSFLYLKTPLHPNAFLDPQNRDSGSPPCTLWLLPPRPQLACERPEHPTTRVSARFSPQAQAAKAARQLRAASVRWPDNAELWEMLGDVLAKSEPSGEWREWGPG